jgi:hypothetical protein
VHLARYPGFVCKARSVHRDRGLAAGRPGCDHVVMGVTYELIDAPYPYLCAVYRCVCGGVEVRHGGDSATPPERWERHPIDGDEEQYLCPGCAAEARRRAAESDAPA